jgi:hypothetical protein
VPHHPCTHAAVLAAINAPGNIHAPQLTALLLVSSTNTPYFSTLRTRPLTSSPSFRSLSWRQDLGAVLLGTQHRVLSEVV